MPNKNYVYKWPIQSDGYAHCNQCNYKHKRASAVGRHAIVHSGKPYVSKKSARKWAEKVAAKQMKQGGKTINGYAESTRRQGINNEEAIAYWIGILNNNYERDAEIIATRVGSPIEEIRGRSLAILSKHSKALRERYRLPD